MGAQVSAAAAKLLNHFLQSTRKNYMMVGKENNAKSLSFEINSLRVTQESRYSPPITQTSEIQILLPLFLHKPDAKKKIFTASCLLKIEMKFSYMCTLQNNHRSYAPQHIYLNLPRKKKERHIYLNMGTWKLGCP